MYLGIGFASGLASVSLWPIRILAEALAVGAAVCFCGAALALPGLLKERFSSSRYDLRELNRLHEREELEQIELAESAEFDSVHCLACGTVYNMQMPLCPHCGAAPGRGPCG